MLVMYHQSKVYSIFTAPFFFSVSPLAPLTILTYIHRIRLIPDPGNSENNHVEVYLVCEIPTEYPDDTPNVTIEVFTPLIILSFKFSSCD